MQSPIDDDRWLRETEDIVLYGTAGRVTSPRAFAEAHRDLLPPLAAELVGAEAPGLSSETGSFDRPLVRTARYSDGEVEMPARRGGARSAYLSEKDLKIKACRPEETTFPHWELDDDFALRVEEIPFGVMTRAGVMRELLAWCFERRHDLPSTGRPVAVFEYGAGGDDLGVALVTHVPGDQRVELFIDCGGLSLHDLIRRRRRGTLEPREVALRGMSREDFVETKASLLVAYTFGGGFRGLLNSNIGNDVIRDGRLHSLCDFDTFQLLPVPEAGDAAAIRYFTMRAHVELIKASLPFVDFLDVDGRSKAEIHAALAAYYREHSTFFRAYTALFRERAGKLGWDAAEIDAAVDAAFATPIAFELFQELVPNSHTARNVQLTSHYIPHN